MEAVRLRSALGNLNVARSQIQGIRSGLIVSPNAQEEIDRLLSDAAEILQEECKLVESGRTPTLREHRNDRTIFLGTLPHGEG